MVKLLYALGVCWVLWSMGGYVWQTIPNWTAATTPLSVPAHHHAQHAHTHQAHEAHHGHQHHGHPSCIHHHNHEAQGCSHHHHGPNTDLDCGFDDLHRELLKQRPALALRAQEAELVWQRRQGGAPPFNATGGVQTVPVVVHLVHNNGPANLSDARVRTAIQHLNDAFANTGYYNPATGVDTEIQFCLASRDPVGDSTSGITRTVSTLTTLDKNTQDLQLKNLSRWDPTRYINIWVVNEILGNTAGYAYFPAAHGTNIDGIVLQQSFMGNGHAESSVLVHEMGHYFGLYHTFEGGCANNDCTRQGDKVCDTPPDNTTTRPPCSTAPNSCTSDEDDTSANNPFRAVALGGQGDQPDQKENYMDYSDLLCYDRFSQGQADRMQFFLHGDRASLLQSQVCQPPCLARIQVGFTASALTTTAGTPITFTDTSINGTTSQWFVDGIPFGNTTTASYNFPTTGTFWVRLVAGNGNPNCIPKSDSIPITVFCVPPCGEICDNGIDDDGNGWIDCYDSTCTCDPCSDQLANHWIFGTQVWLNFNDTGPTVVSNPPTFLITNEGTATTSDPNGNLLFYTNGVVVWNRNHRIMPNFMRNFIRLNGNNSLSQIIVVPKPDDPLIYYIFVPNLESLASTNGLTYSIVDMALDRNLGDVNQYNMLLNTPRTTEAITAIKHCNNKDYWVIVKIFETNQYYVFPITSAGVGTPMIQNIGQIHANIGAVIIGGTMLSTPNSISFMRGSVQGDQLAVSHRLGRGVELFDFDNSTGMLSNPRYWSDPSWSTMYGVEFSPSGQFLYASSDIGGNVYQFDITQPTSAAIQASATLVGFGGRGGDIQLGPDGKIYQAQDFSNMLSRINEPDAAGVACDYQLSAVPVSPSNSEYGLPNHIKAHLMGPLAPFLTGPTAICNNSGSVAHYVIDHAACNLDTLIWRHSGPNTVQSTHDSLLLQANVSGVDTIWATMISPCTSKTDRLIVNTLIGTAGVDLGPDTSVCQNGIVVLNAGGGFQDYRWQDGSRDSTFTAFETGWHWVEGVTPCGDTLRDSVFVTVATVPLLNEPDTTINIGDTLRLAAPTGIYQHTWTPNQDLSCVNCPNPIFYPDSTTIYYHTYTDSLGCVGLDTMEVRVVDNCDPKIRLDSVVSPCFGTSTGSLYTSPYAGTAPFRYVWSNGDTLENLTNVGAGVYQVTITDSRGCSNVDTLTLTASNNPIINIDTVQAAGCGLSNGLIQTSTQSGRPPYQYTWNPSGNTATLSGLSAGMYTLTVTDANGCRDTLSQQVSNGPPPSIGLDTLVADTCLQSQGRLVILPLTENPPYTYIWSNGDTGLVLNDLPAGGVYEVTATSANGCVSINNWTIQGLSLAQLSASINQLGQTMDTVLVGTGIELYAQPDQRILGASYQWMVEPSSGVDLDSLQVPQTTGTAQDSGVYQLMVTLEDIYGCTLTDTVYLRVQAEAPYLGMPNAFTPNGDGSNEVFQPVGLPANSIEIFRVYNRWGQVVFDAEWGPSGWDGTYQGTPQPVEVYLYILRYQLPNAPMVELRGEVTLMR